jgi:hypothetical protein
MVFGRVIKGLHKVTASGSVDDLPSLPIIVPFILLGIDMALVLNLYIQLAFIEYLPLKIGMLLVSGAGVCLVNIITDFRQSIGRTLSQQEKTLLEFNGTMRYQIASAGALAIFGPILAGMECGEKEGFFTELTGLCMNQGEGLLPDNVENILAYGLDVIFMVSSCNSSCA